MLKNEVLDTDDDDVHSGEMDANTRQSIIEARNSLMRQHYASDVYNMVKKPWGLGLGIPNPIYIIGEAYSDYKANEVYSTEVIQVSTQNTTDVMVRKLEPLEWKFFSYLHLQMAMQLQSKLQKAEDLYRDVDTGRLDKQIRMPRKRDISKEFTSIYGPIDKTKSRTLALLKSYFEQKTESVMEHIRFRTFCQGLMLFIGKPETLKLLQFRKNQARQEAQEFFEYVQENIPIYDLNPISSPTHAEWFLIPRANPTHMNYVFRNRELEVLTEFKIMEESAFALEGIWMSVVDCGANYPTRMSEDPLCTTKERHKLSPEDYDTRNLNWRPFYIDLYLKISNHPLGISMQEFLELFNRSRKWSNVSKFLESLTLEEVVNYLPEVFSTEEVPQGLILYPAYMRGR
ncbi:unnamed protein product [Orchesella dallaii]|uniref:Uncharacterized protein n=1 Tax=Orchesella dallaii TaxID=48710 RepID=A0ABP1Q1Y9_9HEXA